MLRFLSRRPDLVTARAVTAYLVAIVAANLLVAHLGPEASIITAFFLVGLDFTVTDTLHDAWQGKRLIPNMAALIGAGTLITFLANHTAGRIGAASFAAFLISTLLDRAVYALALRAGLSRWRRCNWSNLASTAADSYLFPALAFGYPPDPAIVRGQFLAKLAGATIWSLIILPPDQRSRDTRDTGEKTNEQPTATPHLQVRHAHEPNTGPTPALDDHR